MDLEPSPLDLDALASAHDDKSRDVFVSLYVDLSDPTRERALEERAKEVRAALGRDEEARAQFDASLERAREAVGAVAREEGSRGAAVFVSTEHGFARAHALAEPVPTRLVLDSSPYVRPLARFVDEHEPFVLALLDSERAAIYVVDGEGAHKEGSERLDLLGRHKKGGMSQMRYQRHRQGVQRNLLDDVADRVERLLEEGEAERLVLAGPGQAKRQLSSRLRERGKEALMAVEDAEFDGNTDELVRRFSSLAKALEAEDSEDAVAALKGELHRGELATTGAFPVARAARDGRVCLLLVLKDYEAGGAKCEEHEAYFEAGERCPVGGEEGTRVDLANEAVEHAVRSEARIEFVGDDEFLREVGGVAALLRW